MEYVNEEFGIRTPAEIKEQDGMLSSLDEYGEHSSLYDIALLPLVDASESYIVTKDGKLFVGAVKCTETKQKDKINANGFSIRVDGNIFQFWYTFPDGTGIDARGHYARNKLKVVSRRRRK